jgi:hypothetical protein
MLLLFALLVNTFYPGTLWRPSPAHTDNRRTPLIGVVIDTHPQQRNVMAFERHVMDSLAGALAGSEADGFVISYSDHIQPIVDWSRLDSGLREAAGVAVDDIDGRGTTRGAVLNDGLLAGLTKLGSADSRARKSLIVIGEGNDGGSAAKFSQLLDVARGQHIQCFALLVANHRSQVGRVRQFGFDLYRLASGTKGRAYDVRTDPRLLDEALKDVIKRLTVAGQPSL